MRISKEPEVRKQEIIDTAMKVFAEKGYEAATMKDIAEKMRVAPGLCYHYFQNKQLLYETAVKQYAQRCSFVFVEIFKQTDLSLYECMDKMGQAWFTSLRDGGYAYESFFHKKGNELFHRQLEMEMCHAVLPFAVLYLDELKTRDEIHITDTRAAAQFILNGQMDIINDQELPVEKRFELVKEIILKVLA